jgi:hypothetical protein
MGTRSLAFIPEQLLTCIAMMNGSIVQQDWGTMKRIDLAGRTEAILTILGLIGACALLIWIFFFARH